MSSNRVLIWMEAYGVLFLAALIGFLTGWINIG